jgi:regulator of protease activity HflC (stomatin/prohibitin superfamily)
MTIFAGVAAGFIAWFLVRYLVAGLYTVNQNERAVKTSFGRALRIGQATTLDDPISEPLQGEERERYVYPQVQVIPPGGPYFKWPWERIYKVTVAVNTVSMAYDPESPAANEGGTRLNAVTKDQLDTGMTGQIRFPRLRAESLRVVLRCAKSDRARHGLLHQHPPRTNRELRGARRQRDLQSPVFDQ